MARTRDRVRPPRVGAVGLILDSHGMYALALDRHSAAAELGLGAGDAVLLARLDDERRSPGLRRPRRAARETGSVRPRAPRHDARHRAVAAGHPVGRCDRLDQAREEDSA